MTPKRKGTVQRIVDTISGLMRQPFSDESNEVPTAAAVKRSKAIAAGKKTRKAPKAKKAATKKRSTGGKKAKSAARKKKR
jgi:hypothetical protein